MAYVPYDDIVRAFAGVGINAAFDEGTREKEFQAKVRRFEARSAVQVEEVKQGLLSPSSGEGRQTPSGEPPMVQFLAALSASLSRGVQGITVVVLHGQPRQLTSATEAIAYLRSYKEMKECAAPASKYEIHVRYNTGDVIDAIFQQKPDAIQFLLSYV